MFELPPYRPRNAKPCRDHTGRDFPSFTAMARAWGLTPSMLWGRLNRKWPLEQALTGLPGARQVCCDHTGRKFPTVAAMARAWGLPAAGLRERLFRKWPLDKALTVPYGRHAVAVADPESGVICSSAAELARGYGIKPLVMQARIRKGMTGAALVFPGDLRMASARDHTGREFPSLAAMARAWGQPYKRFERRLASGWDIERALTVSPDAARGSPVSDHTGREFPSFRAMARAWGQPYKRFERRLALGWELERALTAPGSRRGRPKNKEKK